MGLYLFENNKTVGLHGSHNLSKGPTTIDRWYLGRLSASLAASRDRIDLQSNVRAIDDPSLLNM